MNKVNERAHATDPKYVGNIDNLFKEYFLKTKEHKLKLDPKSWKKFHKMQKLSSTLEGKKVLKKKLKIMKTAINEITNKMIEEWYDFFLYQQTFFGKYQEFLIMDYFESLGKKVEINRNIISNNKIDLIVEHISCQVKPLEYRNQSNNIPFSDEIVYIYYKKVKKGIDFYWDSKILDDLLKSNIKEAKI